MEGFGEKLTLWPSFRSPADEDGMKAFLEDAQVKEKLQYFHKGVDVVE